MEVTIVSETSPLSGQKYRSSNNFTTADLGGRLTFYAYYRYGEKDQQEAKDIIFDIKVDKTGHDPTFLDSISSGYSHDNTKDRNLYIANPHKATERFTVVVRG